MTTVPVQIPKLTFAAIDATFMEWLVEDGRQVLENQPIYIVETEKVETEVVAPATGTLHHGAVEALGVYPVGFVLATIEIES